ncbi:KTSC domain-containing protein [Kitasatospora kazusensis]|uniref:KTSC domain-containing protein n=1 Tax=Kitasatospora kazusensis TaxID=407974 RepID=A0ABP5KSV1_9ACTN
MAVLRTPVESSCLRSVGYDEAARELEVEFTSGAVYRYFDVPVSVRDGLMGAPSHGRYFCRDIRGHFRYRRTN